MVSCAPLQCFGGLFRPRAAQSNVNSTSDAPKTALSASEESSAATAACAQHQSTETCQQRPTANSTLIQLPPAAHPPAPQPPAAQFVAPSPFCNGRPIAHQQPAQADSVVAPSAVTIIIAGSRNTFAAEPKIPAHVSFVSEPKQPPVLAGPVSASVPPRTAAQMASSRNEFAAAPRIPAHTPFVSGPKQPPVLAGPGSTPRTAAQMASSRNEFAAAPDVPAHVPFTSAPKQSLVLAEPVLTSVPPRTAAQMARGGQNRSRCAMEAFSAMSCITGPSAGAFASLGQGNRVTQQEPEKLGGVPAGQLQLQRSGLLSTQGSLERRDSCPGLMATEASFSWDYIQPKVSSKDFLGQRKKDIRGSLDLDFENEVPMAVTRRSKEYGEQRPYVGAGFGAGRSYSGSVSDNSFNDLK